MGSITKVRYDPLRGPASGLIIERATTIKFSFRGLNALTQLSSATRNGIRLVCAPGWAADAVLGARVSRHQPASPHSGGGALSERYRLAEFPCGIGRSPRDDRDSGRASSSTDTSASSNGRIISVSDKQPDIPNAVAVNTEGIIVPGFIDVHNHLPWNALPRWTPPHLYANRSQWRSDPIFQAAGARSFRQSDWRRGSVTGVGNICDMNAYSEMRALVGGVTSILATHAVPCIHGLVRNLDFNSGFLRHDGARSRASRQRDRDSAGHRSRRPAQFVGLAQFAIAYPVFEGLFLHVAEGVDAFSLEEFTFAQSHGLLCSKCMRDSRRSRWERRSFKRWRTPARRWSGRRAATSRSMARRRTSMPRSTPACEIALAPDWAISGSGNMLDELHFADSGISTHLSGRLTDRQLVDMVTSIPAAEGENRRRGRRDPRRAPRRFSRDQRRPATTPSVP